MSTIKADEIYIAVKERYGRLAAAPASCCEPRESYCEADPGDAYFDNLYTADTSALPTEVTEISLGCGDPITLANLKAGQTVLDLGSGGGIDCFLAAARVGESGRVIGVDMTDEMLAKAERNKAKVGVQNVEFRKGMIEALPVEDNSVDVIISNCVVNLSPDKPAVFREAYRVLRPGGRLAISDMVRQGEFTPEEQADMIAWSGCITGAETVAFYATELARVGFSDISIRERDAADVELAGAGLPQPEKARAFSARITAVKK